MEAQEAKLRLRHRRDRIAHKTELLRMREIAKIESEKIRAELENPKYIEPGTRVPIGGKDGIFAPAVSKKYWEKAMKEGRMPPTLGGTQELSTSSKPFVSEATGKAENVPVPEKTVLPEATAAPQVAAESRRALRPEEIPAPEERFEEEDENPVYNYCLTAGPGTPEHERSA